MKRVTGLLFAGVILLQAGSAAGAEKVILLDEFRYASAEAAGAQWKPLEKDFPPVGVGTVGGRPALKLPCNFSTNEHWRLGWERSGEWDLSACQEIALDVNADRGRPAFMVLYLQSGPGWHRCWLSARAGTNTLTLPCEKFEKEGKPAGWDKITAIRLFVLHDEVNRTILVSSLRGLARKPKNPMAVALNRLGKVAGFGGVRELTAAIKANLRGQPKERLDAVALMLAEAGMITRDAGMTMERGDSAKAVAMLADAQQAYLRAYAASVPSKPGEFRAVWCHDPKGIRGMSWDQALKTLSEVGFNAIIVNMSWGDAAAYKSKLLPMVGDKKRDLLAECAAAGKKHGIAVHAWKCNLRCQARRSGQFHKKLRREGRLMQDCHGKTVEYAMCPSDPANVKLEVDSMVEMARDYDIAGIHFDYIRFPGDETCYCSRCRKQFEAEYKVKVKNWPADVRTGELKKKYLQFRRDRITNLVAAVSKAAHKAKPDTQISAAVFWHWPSARVYVGQDWKLWVEKGYLDFVCPMQYIQKTADFETQMQAISRWVDGRIPLMPGIGLVRLMTPDQTLHHILITRKYKTAGFVLFQYRPPPDKEHLPILHLGATAEKSTWTPPKRKTDK